MFQVAGSAKKKERKKGREEVLRGVENVIKRATGEDREGLKMSAEDFGRQTQTTETVYILIYN